MLHLLQWSTMVKDFSSWVYQKQAGHKGVLESTSELCITTTITKWTLNEVLYKMFIDNKLPSKYSHSPMCISHAQVRLNWPHIFGWTKNIFRVELNQWTSHTIILIVIDVDDEKKKGDDAITDNLPPGALPTRSLAFTTRGARFCHTGGEFWPFWPTMQGVDRVPAWLESKWVGEPDNAGGRF